MKIPQKTYYVRTLGFMKYLNCNVGAIEESNHNSIDMYSKLRDLIHDENLLNQNARNRLDEILDIEHQKMLLHNNKSEIASILDFELGCFKTRDIVLNQALIKSYNTEFTISPYVTTYESYWNWSVLKDDFHISKFENILNQPKTDFYFVLQQTGIFDSRTMSNILELPLTEYEFFLLSLFEEPSTVISVIQAFEKEFEYNSKEEKDQLRANAEALIRILIFQMFIV